MDTLKKRYAITITCDKKKSWCSKETVKKFKWAIDAIKDNKIIPHWKPEDFSIQYHIIAKSTKKWIQFVLELKDGIESIDNDVSLIRDYLSTRFSNICNYEYSVKEINNSGEPFWLSNKIYEKLKNTDKDWKGTSDDELIEISPDTIKEAESIVG